MAIQQVLLDNLAVLNAALNRDDMCPLRLTEQQIVLGDPTELPRTRLSIVGGGEADGQDMEIEQVYMPILPTSGYKEEIKSDLWLYIHPNEFGGLGWDAQQEATAREVARSRICDTLRKRIFNTRSYVTLGLLSREHCSVPDTLGFYDKLAMCHIREVKKGVADKMAGRTTMVLSAQLTHVGTIQ
jgi:hypothetical protein